MEDNLKDFTINWAIFGLLFISLLSFAIVFMANNNPNGLGDDATSILGSANGSTNSHLYEIESNSNELKNITSKTNPETSYLGSRDSVATSFKSVGSAQSFFNSSKTMIGWVFSGDTGQILISTFSGLIGFLVFYFGYKFIRSGS